MLTEVLKAAGYTPGGDGDNDGDFAVSVTAAGEVLTRWSHNDPKPTDQQLADWQADAANLPSGKTFSGHKLDEAKAAKMAAIDAKSRELISAGLDVGGGMVLSFSGPAQRNMIALQVGLLAGKPVLPQGLSTLDGGEYVVADPASASALADKYQTTITGILNGGRSLRKQVLAATTIAAVDAINDDRT